MYLTSSKFIMQILSFYRHQSFLLFSLLFIISSISLTAQDFQLASNYQDWIKADAKVELHMFSAGGHGFGMNELNSPVDRWSQLLIDWILSL